jgi:hypothetical protein
VRGARGSVRRMSAALKPARLGRDNNKANHEGDNKRPKFSILCRKGE